MSSSDPRSATAQSSAAVPTPWALDELEMLEVFHPDDDNLFGSVALSHSGTDATEDGPALSEDELAAVHHAEQKAEREALEQAAFARGHAAGVADSHEQAQAQVARVVQALVDATASVQAHEQRWLGNVEENLAAMAVTVAQHLMHRELTSDPTVVTELITRSLQAFPLEQRITVRLHPDDLVVVQDALEAGQIEGTGGREVRWQADSNIVRGGCLVDGRERVLDGRIDTALERAYRALGQVQA